MVPSFVIGFRETFEAALIIGILLIYLKKIEQKSYYKHIFAGCAAGVIASLLFGLVPGFLDSFFSAVNKNVFNATILYVAVAVMTSMLIFMHHTAHTIKGELERKTQIALNENSITGLLILSFAGVFREGVETVLFMWGTVTSAASSMMAAKLIMTCIGGGMFAILLSWLFFNKMLGSFSIKNFFRYTGILLLLITAGMFAKATGKLIKADMLPPIIEQVWDSSWILNEKGTITGKIFSAMTGYISKPSLLELVAYFGYAFAMIAAIFSKDFISKQNTTEESKNITANT